ncbi:MAG: flagellar basal body-associated FliL family protein [Paracoccaceae bacterium]
MLQFVIPIILAIIGTSAGVAAGLALRSPPEVDVEKETPKVADAYEDSEGVDDHRTHDDEGHLREYVKLNNQFVVPVVQNDLVSALIVIALSVEVSAGLKEEIYLREPKIRDSFLRVLFDHANMGGFSGEFTNADTLDMLRGSLREVAQRDIGEMVSDVLIIDIARQDM